MGPRTRSSTRFPGRQERLGNANGAVCRAGLIAVRGSVLPGMPDIQTNVSTRSPRCCLARASGEESTHQPLPLTLGSTRNTSLPPTQAPTTAGDRGRDVTDGQDAPIAEYLLLMSHAVCARAANTDHPILRASSSACGGYPVRLDGLGCSHSDHPRVRCRMALTTRQRAGGPAPSCGGPLWLPSSRPWTPSARSPRTAGSARSMCPPRWSSRPGTASCRPAASLSWPGRSRARRSTRWTPVTGPASTRRTCSPRAARGLLAGSAWPRRHAAHASLTQPARVTTPP